jgi:hypothetical protein
MAIIYRQNQEGRLSVEQMDGNFSYIDHQLIDLNSSTMMLEEATSFLQQEVVDIQDTVAGITASIVDVIAPLTYIGLATQRDEQAPIFIELQNTIGEITWEYSDVGSYIGTVGTTFSYIFVPNNDAIFATPLGLSPSFIYLYQITKLNDSSISLITMPFEGPGQGGSYDNILFDTPIEIKFYK